jgi:hypothetical protein
MVGVTALIKAVASSAEIDTRHRCLDQRRFERPAFARR